MHIAGIHDCYNSCVHVFIHQTKPFWPWTIDQPGICFILEIRNSVLWKAQKDHAALWNTLEYLQSSFSHGTLQNFIFQKSLLSKNESIPRSTAQTCLVIVCRGCWNCTKAIHLKAFGALSGDCEFLNLGLQQIPGFVSIGLPSFSLS